MGRQRFITRCTRFIAARGRDARRSDDRDRGAILVLALLFVLAVGLVATALATWATNDLNNSKTFTSVEALHSDATGMMKLSVSYVRYNPLISGSQAANVPSPVVACWGGTNVANLPLIDNNQVAVWCSTVWNPGLSATRVVTFYACAASVPASVCTSPGKALLTEVVTFDDYPKLSSGNPNAPNQTLCSLSCGSGMTVNGSTWGSSLVDTVAATPSTVSFTAEPSATIVNAATTAQVEVLDAGGLPISGQTVTLSAVSPGSLASGSSVSEVTNVEGVAVFNNVVPATAGSVVLQATDGSLSATSTAFTVGQGANAITINAATPSNPQVGSVVTLLPSPAASATSGDTVLISGTSGICTVSGGAVTMVAVGNCVLSFSDAGNANYVAATPVTMSFSVVPVPAASIAISSSQTSLAASGVTNDTLTLTLLSASGASTTSNGTTAVTLGQNGSGFFAANLGTTGGLTTATFANGAATTTVYFGDTATTNSVTVTASKQGLTSGTASIRVVPAAASQIVVAAASPVAASSVSNASVSISIEDQFGNVVSPSSATTLTYSSGSTTGFFTQATNSSTPHITSVVLPAGTGAGTVYFYDTKAETVNVTVTASSGVGGSANITVNAATSPHAVVITTSTPVFTSSTSNDPVTISLQDAYGNTITPSAPMSISLSSSGSGYFTATNGGNSHISSAAILSGQPSVTVYFGDTSADNPATIRATEGSIFATSSIDVTASPPTQISVAASSPIAKSQYSGDAVTITLEDASGAQVNATSDTNIALSCAPNQHSCYFTTSSGQDSYSNGVTITSVTIPQGSSSVTVYFGDRSKTHPNNDDVLTASSPGLTSGTASVQVN